MSGALSLYRGERIARCLGTLAAALCLAFSGAARADDARSLSSASMPVNALVAALAWKDVDGKSYDKTQLAQKKATVFVFISTQCPLSNLYTPRLLALATPYRAHDVQFFLVDSNREDSLEVVKRYAAERNVPFPIVKDEGTSLADRLNAFRTPEAVILDSSGVVRYRGRIDDNSDREKVVHQDLREALDALLAGGPVARPRTIAVGCAIFRDAAKPPVAGPATVTYARDVAPILHKNCVGCHRKGDVAPFALETYAQAQAWAAPIKDYTARRLMPPWKAVPGFGDFHDARVLTDVEIAVLAKWADAGAPQGDLKELPPPPQFAVDWALGKPDMVVQSVRPYHLEAEGRDVYREFVLPADFKEDRYVRGIAFKAGNPAIVHHIIVYYDSQGTAAQMDGKEAEPGYSRPPGDVGIGVPGALWIAGWAPGNTPRLLPKGTAFKFAGGGKIVLQVHYHKSGKPEIDQSQIALYFADKATVDKVMHVGAVINTGFVLKPGEAKQEVRGSVTLPVDVTVHAVFPHMHMLGREMKITATRPGGRPEPLIWINAWDFNWQETYRYKQPIALPTGSSVQMEALFDNSEQNPNQPSHPPKEVHWGEQTTDEMCIGFFQFTFDREHLAAALRERH